MPRFEDLVITRWGARYRGVFLPCAVGRGGIGVKQGEGDGITPTGIHRLLEIRVRPDRLDIDVPHLPVSPIAPDDIWSDDPVDPRYNTGLRARGYKFSHEALRRADPLYDAIGVLDFNYPTAESGKGSAIFLHVWRKPRHPTEGCIAFDPRNLCWIFTTWDPKAKVVVLASKQCV